MLGHAVTSFPAGDVAFRLNAMSGVFGALAAVAIYAIVYELTRHRLSAFAAALTLAFSYHFWGQSLIAEVYTLDAALVGGMLYAICIWQRTQRPVAVYAVFFLLGLALAHRTTSALYLPPLIAWGLAGGALRNVDISLRAACCVIPGLALYVVLPILYTVQPDYMWNAGYTPAGEPAYVDLTTRPGLTWYVSAAVFRPLVFAFGPERFAGEALRYLGWLWSEFAGIGVVLGLAGLRRAWREHRPFLYLTGGAFVLQALFYTGYGAADKDQMFIPTYLIWSVWIGLGVRELIDLVASGYLRSLALPAAQALALGLPLALLVTNGPQLNFAGDDPLGDEAARLFAAAPANTLVIGDWGDIAALQYGQTVEHQRPDLTLVGQWALTREGLDQLIATNIDSRPVYLLDDVPSLHHRYRFVKTHTWYRLLAESQQRQPLIPEGGS